MERRADDAERELLQWKKVRFMADKVGDEFDGYVTGVAAFGLFVELVEHFVEGLVHVSTMADDYYRFVETRARAARREHGKRLPARRQGAACRSIRVDMERRQIDLGLVEILERVRARRARPRRRGAARRGRSTSGAPAPARRAAGRRERRAGQAASAGGATQAAAS